MVGRTWPLRPTRPKLGDWTGTTSIRTVATLMPLPLPGLRAERRRTSPLWVGHRASAPVGLRPRHGGTTVLLLGQPSPLVHSGSLPLSVTIYSLLLRVVPITIPSGLL